MKINSKVHGILDYLVVLFLWLSPTLFALTSTATVFCYGLGVVHLALTLCTHYELGVVKFIPLKIHGAIELMVSVILLPLAFYLGSIEGELARNYFIGFAIAVFIVWVLSDYANKPESTREIPYVESSTDSGML